MPRPTRVCFPWITTGTSVESKVPIEESVRRCLFDRGFELAHFDRAAWDIAKVLFKVKDGGYWSIEARAFRCSVATPESDVDDVLYDDFICKLNHWREEHA